MLSCEDITTEGMREDRLKLVFIEDDAEYPEEILHIMMRKDQAVDMAKWIMQNWGHTLYQTREQWLEQFKKECAEKI